MVVAAVMSQEGSGVDLHKPPHRGDMMESRVTFQGQGDGNEERLRINSLSSVDSGFEGLENMEPLDLGSVDRLDGLGGHDSGHEDEEHELQPDVSLFSVAMMMIRQSQTTSSPGLPVPLGAQVTDQRSRAKSNWLRALAIVRKRGKVDPWDKFHWPDLPVEKATRHRYDALSKSWTQDQVFVRMDEAAFDQGAMRECFRMKKMDNFCPDADWQKDSNNYVAKRYKKGSECQRETYFDDIRLQMDAKLWGEEYNRHNPPKKVDIFMVTVYEFPERPGSPLFHVEHFIEGNYIKYNSNSGFVDGKACRQTPHAFSHFTFECSGHELIVVDVQGVGDLYTDPQIHTVDGSDYGDGNLGIKGMALFFHSHSCNAICQRLGLSPFALSHQERQEISSHSGSITSASQTVLRGREVALSESPVDEDTMSTHLQAFFRQRNVSRNFTSLSDVFEEESSPRMSVSGERSDSYPRIRNESADSAQRLAAARNRGRRGTDFFADSHNHLQEFINDVRLKKRSTCLNNEMRRTMQCYNESVLGMVHLELAKYHEICRFTETGHYDKFAALFHMRAAADCGVVDAIINVANIFCGIPHDILTEVSVKDADEDEQKTATEIGLEYMERAAHAGDRNAMVYMARAYDTGLNLSHPSQQSFGKALYWYEEIQECDERDQEDGKEPVWGMGDPPYVIMAREAEILLMDDVKAVGKNPTKAGDLYNLAAESAMACMKGKLATKYYMLAEEAYSQVEE